MVEHTIKFCFFKATVVLQNPFEHYGASFRDNFKSIPMISSLLPSNKSFANFNRKTAFMIPLNCNPVQSTLYIMVTLEKWSGDRYVQGDRYTVYRFLLNSS